MPDPLTTMPPHVRAEIKAHWGVKQSREIYQVVAQWLDELEQQTVPMNDQREYLMFMIGVFFALSLSGQSGPDRFIDRVEQTMRSAIMQSS